jgi:hypothetical protein
MKRLSLLTLLFAVLSLIFFLLLVFLRTPFSLYPLMSYQDVFDLLTPLALFPLYWLMFKSATSEGPNQDRNPGLIHETRSKRVQTRFMRPSMKCPV